MDFYEVLHYTEVINNTEVIGYPAFTLSTQLSLRSKSNYRSSKTKSAMRQWKEHKEFEQSLASLTDTLLPKEWARPGPSGEDLFKTLMVIVADTTIDAANFAKSVTDAFEGVLYVNDRTVTSISSVLNQRVTKNGKLWITAAQVPLNLTYQDTLQVTSKLLLVDRPGIS